jgi:hypothetical protein
MQRLTKVQVADAEVAVRPGHDLGDLGIHPMLGMRDDDR